jgi:hypothetical protein
MKENLRHQDKFYDLPARPEFSEMDEFNDVRSVILNLFCIRPVRIARSFGTQVPRFETSVPSLLLQPERYLL